MKELGSKTLETSRLILHATEEKDLKVLWTILWDERINRYYLTSKINEDWEIEKKFQYKKLERANNKDIFCWTIELKKTNEIIGQLSVQEGKEKQKKEVRDLGWFIDVNFQKKGYAYEAALEVLKYMFLEVEIEKIETSSAIVNSNSWNLLEKLGFKRQKTTHFEQYTFIEEPQKVYEYELTKKNFLKEYFRKQELYITEDIDKDPYMKHISDAPIINITGESGSGKTTMIEEYQNMGDCIVVDTDELFKGNMKELQDYLEKKYGSMPDRIEEFDKLYLGIIEYYKDTNKLLIIDSAQFRNIKDIHILQGEIIVLRTCINTCYQRCIERYEKNHPNTTFEELVDYQNRKKEMYRWYHSLNHFLDRLDKDIEGESYGTL